MIICMLREQAEIFVTLDNFEVDMSFKRIKDIQMNEIIFATKLRAHGKST